MRASWFLLVLGCQSAAPSPTTTPIAHAPASVKVTHEHEAIDVIAALGTGELTSWIAPGPAQLSLGGPSLDAPATSDPLPVILLDDQGSDVRVGVRLDNVWFTLWMPRARLLAMVAREQRVSSRTGDDFVMPSEWPVEVALRDAARVYRLAHHDGWTQIRYIGAFEVNGWVPDAALVDRASRGTASGRIPSGHQTQLVTPGAVIRSEPRWSARDLATVANGYLVDVVREVDDAWLEVSYADGEMRVHGYLSRRDPPGSLHRPHEAEVAPPTITANATVANRTCLYADEHGEAIGFVRGDRPAQLEPARPGWYVVSFDTPWGAVAFRARGPSETTLDTCGPTS